MPDIHTVKVPDASGGSYSNHTHALLCSSLHVTGIPTVGQGQKGLTATFLRKPQSQLGNQTACPNTGHMTLGEALNLRASVFLQSEHHQVQWLPPSQKQHKSLTFIKVLHFF